MRVLVVHNRYRSDQPSGENTLVDGEMEQLRAAGVHVVPYLRSSDEIAEMAVPARLLVPLRPLHAPGAQREIATLLQSERIDVVHLHNPYPLISYDTVRTAHRAGVPVVQTIHNHRHTCVKGTYWRDGHPCTSCRGTSFHTPAVVHGCYRDSRLQSVPMALALRRTAETCMRSTTTSPWRPPFGRACWPAVSTTPASP